MPDHRPRTAGAEGATGSSRRPASHGTVLVLDDFNHAILNDTAHRPWVIPTRPWVMTQTWHHLLFAHWAVPPEAMRHLVPAVFELELFDGRAWIGIVPFYMTNVAPRFVPSLPWVSEFPELNVRTYVRAEDKPGVFFFSLDAGSALAVHTARTMLNLPYHSAAMTVTPRSDGVTYESRRDAAGQPAEFRAVYRPAGDVFTAAAGSLEYFLTERYCLYHVTRRGRPYRLDIHHPPWPLQPAQAELERNTMADVNGLTLPAEPPVLHFSRRQDMVAWTPSRVRSR